MQKVHSGLSEGNVASLVDQSQKNSITDAPKIELHSLAFLRGVLPHTWRGAALTPAAPLAVLYSEGWGGQN